MEERAEDVIEFFIAADPVAQGRGRIVKRGGFYGIADPPKSRDWKAGIRAIAQAYAQDPLWDVPLAMALTIVCQKPKSAKKGEVYKASRPDLSNYEKGIEDALEGVIYTNDSRICVKNSRKVYGSAPGIRIRIWML